MRVSAVVLALVVSTQAFVLPSSSCLGSHTSAFISTGTATAAASRTARYGTFDSEFSKMNSPAASTKPPAHTTSTYSGYGHDVIPPAAVGPQARLEVEAAAAALAEAFGRPLSEQKELMTNKAPATGLGQSSPSGFGHAPAVQSGSTAFGGRPAPSPPAFSGFGGQTTPAASSGNPPAFPTTPANGNPPAFPTTPVAAAAPPAPPKTVFSGFGHSTPAAAPAGPKRSFSGFGHSAPKSAPKHAFSGFAHTPAAPAPVASTGNPPAFPTTPAASTGNPPAFPTTPAASTGNPPAFPTTPAVSTGNPPAFPTTPAASTGNPPAFPTTPAVSTGNPPAFPTTPVAAAPAPAPPKPVFSGFGHSTPAAPAAAPAGPKRSFSGFGHSNTTPKAAPKHAFSGFAHSTAATPAPAAIPAPVTTPAPATTPAPQKRVFSGFGHAVAPPGAAAAASTAPKPAFSAFTASPPAPAPARGSSTPGFSGFGHASAPTAATPQPPKSAFGSHFTNNPAPANPEVSTATTSNMPAPPSLLAGQAAALEAGAAVLGTVDEDDDDDEEYDFSLDPDLLEATEYLYAARDKVLQLRDEISHKEDQQAELVQSLKTDLKDKQEGFEKKLTTLAEQYQQYKMDAHKEKQSLTAKLDFREAELQEKADIREAELKVEIAELEIAIAKARIEIEEAQNLTAVIIEEKEELQAEFEEMRQEYTHASLEWEDRIENEQTARVKDRALADKVINQVKQEASSKIRQARADGRIMQQAVRTDLNNNLWQKETLLQKTQLSLKRTTYERNELEDRVDNLKSQREDLSSLTKQTAKVAKLKAENVIQKGRNFFRRNKLG